MGNGAAVVALLGVSTVCGGLTHHTTTLLPFCSQYYFKRFYLYVLILIDDIHLSINDKTYRIIKEKNLNHHLIYFLQLTVYSFC